MSASLRRMAHIDQTARLEITLDRVEPPVLRRIEVPLEIRLDDLHLAIQIAMGWENCHLYEFRTRVGRWSVPDPDFDMPDNHSATSATLSDLLKKGGAKTFKYVYDFGDGWEHTVKVEAVAPAVVGAPCPRLLEARCACPPEDVGGPWGYAEYLEAIADPDHEQHKDMIRWRGPGFDPAAVDADGIRKRLEGSAKPAARRRAKAATRRAR